MPNQIPEGYGATIRWAFGIAITVLFTMISAIYVIFSERLEKVEQRAIINTEFGIRFDERLKNVLDKVTEIKDFVERRNP